jgi:predicted membrane-bound spermidine synthase
MQYIRSFFASLGRYELIAFVTGFVLMAYELIASRLLAPSIGSSTYVWTSVIGVMIAALALGYACGGWLADKRVAVQDVAYLLLLSAILMAASLLTYESVLGVITAFIPDTRAQGVVAAAVLFMPTSFLLGVISPYLARLRVKSVATAGRSVASLSALNSLGGISGTFVTGFVFFSYIGSRESLVLLVALLVFCSWLLVPRVQRAGRAVATFMLFVILAMQLATPAQAATVHIDTPSGHYQIESGMYEGRNIKALVTGPTGMQSGIFTDGSRDLVFAYTQAMADVVNQAPHKDRVLMLGGGVYTLPEYIAKEHPDTLVDVVEIDPHLERIAKEHFGYTAPENVRSIAEDARTFTQYTQQKYDVILVDVFNEQTTPFSLSTREFAAALGNILQPGGVVVVNIIGGLSEGCKPLLTSLDASYRSAFATGMAIPIGDPEFEKRQNIIAVYAHDSLSWLDVPSSWAGFPQDKTTTLTDNFAPVELLTSQCRR